jgi:hypothetical protein
MTAADTNQSGTGKDPTQLHALIRGGINAPHVSAKEAERELRRYAERLARKDA